MNAISIVLVGGSSILCGTYMGKNQQDRMQNVFSLNLLLSLITALVFAGLHILFALFDLTGFLTRDPAVRPIFNRYLLGQALGTVPLTAIFYQDPADPVFSLTFGACAFCPCACRWLSSPCISSATGRPPARMA